MWVFGNHIHVSSAKEHFTKCESGHIWTKICVNTKWL
jgi:hypothetical protein